MYLYVIYSKFALVLVKVLIDYNINLLIHLILLFVISIIFLIASPNIIIIILRGSYIKKLNEEKMSFHIIQNTTRNSRNK